MGLQSSDIIPNLPNELGTDCLLRVSSRLHPCLYSVCKNWKNFLTSSDFKDRRKRCGFVDQFGCFVQALPQDDQSTPRKHPVYGVSVYDFKLRCWDRLPPVPDYPDGLPFYCQCISVGENLVLLGGWSPATWEATKRVYIFSFLTGKWRRAADMLGIRSFFACGVVGDLVLVAGGHDDSKNALNTAEVYNLRLDEWRALPEMSQERDECKGVVLGGKFYVISGYATKAQGQFARSADVFDPLEVTWSETKNIWPMGTCPSVVLTLGEHLLAFHKQELLLYNAQQGAWSILDFIPKPIHLAPCATLFSHGSSDLLIVAVSAPNACTHAFYLYRFNSGLDRGSGEWVALEVEHEFASLALVACTVEI